MPRTVTRARGELLFCTAVLIVTAVLLAGCSTQANPARPVEEEQIKNVVKDYFIRSGSIPDYEATIEEVDGNWARVRIAPVGVTNVNGETILYLQNQDQTVQDAPPPTLDVQPGNQASLTTPSGWTIVAGPKSDFTDAELNAASVPAAIRR